MAVDGDPTTAWRVADRPTRSASARLDIAEPIDHLDAAPTDGAGAVRHIGR